MKYLILGAGPSGLAFANRLLQRDETSFLVLEKEKEAGGLCRSAMVEDAPLDIGGGHFLDTRRKEVLDFLFRFMPEKEWNYFERDSRIEVNGEQIHHPIEANIWEMSQENQKKYLESIANAGCNQGQPMPSAFCDWIYWKLGDRIAEDYMLPYNRKMFGDHLEQLGIYWLDKLPNVSYEETLMSCQNHRAYGTQPGHASFYYPKKYGYGELWLRMAEKLKDHMMYQMDVCRLDTENSCVYTRDGQKFCAEKIVTTVPWKTFDEIVGMPEQIKADIDELKHTSVQIQYADSALETGAHWIYYPDPELSYHRILVRKNFVPGSRGYWTETNIERSSSEDDRYTYTNEYAYPLNTANKPEIMRRLKQWCEENSVLPLGRWGEHQHFNSDVVVERAVRLADSLVDD